MDSLNLLLQNNLTSILIRIVLLCFVILAVSPVSKWAERFTQKIFTKRSNKGGLPPADLQHAATVGTMLGSIARFLVWVLAAGICLGILGLDKAVTSLITAAGIGGLAIGFGAQKIIQDVIAGLFLLMDRPCAVGDMVRIGPVTGTVQAIRMRSVVIESVDGETHIIPNGSVATVTNLSGTFGLAAVEIAVGTDKDYDETQRLLEESAKQAVASRDDVVDAPKVLGITALTPAAMTLRTECRTKPARQLEVERAIRAGQLAALKKAGFL